MLILAILAFGMGIGWFAQLVLGKGGRQTDWAMALIAGLAGSFIGGLLFSLVAGDGLKIRPSGIIGSFVGGAHHHRDLAAEPTEVPPLIPRFRQVAVIP